jgi:hypothetical protein
VRFSWTWLAVSRSLDDKVVNAFIKERDYEGQERMIIKALMGK